MADENDAGGNNNSGGDNQQQGLNLNQGDNNQQQGDNNQQQQQQENEPEFVDWKTESLTEHFPDEYKIQEFESNLLLQVINDNKLNADQAKSYLEAHQTYQKQLDSAIENHEKELSEQWWEETKNDPVVGGNNWPKTEERVMGLLNQYADQDFRDFMMAAGGNVNLSVIRFLNKVAERLPREGRQADGDSNQGGRNNQQLSQAQRLFGGNS